MGSTTNLTDQFGRVVGRADYNEWGQITYKDALDITSSYRRIYPQLSYTGHDWDDVLGMYYAKARFYDADTKRFVAIDPIKGSVTDPLSLVSYIYCEDNPLRWVDPLGLRPVKDDPRESFTTKTTLPKPKAPRPAADVKKLTNNEKKQKQNPGVSKPDPKQTLNEAKQNAALPTPKEQVIVPAQNSTYLTGSDGTQSFPCVYTDPNDPYIARQGTVYFRPEYSPKLICEGVAGEGISESVAFLVSVQASILTVRDSHGNEGLLITIGGGGGISTSFLPSAVLFKNEELDTIYDLRGVGQNTNFDLPVISLEADFANPGDGISAGSTTGISIIPGLDIGFSTNITYSWLIVTKVGQK